MLKKIQPKLTLAGAGPGDPDLITAKAIQAIGKADVILYDSLINPILLNYAPASVKKIFVGKRNDQPSFKQEHINDLIVDLAFIYGHVVRLKGGDPFVFGRGYEEIEHARLFNIETEVIPGISSSTGVLALNGIPVTHRGLSESFWVVTGTTRTGELSNDIRLAAKSTATVVILMGIKKLHEIIEVYKSAGKSKIPIAIIQNGTLPNEKTIIGTIDTIAEIAQLNNIQSPAIIVVGEVVRLHYRFIEKRIMNDFFVN
ncbi:MAG TPA: uroporphyrinogen-III C-methyltransferase [Bacteroidia bacterium]|jgi:uroporphyrin-III C-methyltransferase|nr:uroporphyrinogen-III C-methyltransferase [Bacteroidia bacterium]